MPRRVLVLVVLLLVAAGGGAWWYFVGAASSGAWQGYAEADYVKVGAVTEGQVVSVAVARGDAVAAGAALFAQDDGEERASRDQAARQLDQARRSLANLEAAGKPTEIAEAKAALADAKATLVRSRADLDRGAALLGRGNTSPQNVDQLRAEALSAAARVESAEAALTQIQAPMGRETEIEAQRAAVAALEAALAAADWRLAQRHVTAPAGGRVVDVIVQPGETVAAAAPVVSLLPPGNIFVRFFVPEAVVGGLHRGDPVRVSCDGCVRPLEAKISFVSPTAEYTPPVIYSEASRSKLVFLVEARTSPADAAALNPGQPVSVEPVPAR